MGIAERNITFVRNHIMKVVPEAGIKDGDK